jgi:uncharacterized protein (TIGR03492 family)
MDRISRVMAVRLLVLSNGHGEDLIALRVLQALRARRPQLDLAVVPLVGEGSVFAAAETEGWLQRIGPRQSLPSGGFSNQSLGGLLRDLAAGLPLLSWRQWRLVRRWGRQGGAVLAVGDLLPLLLAWASGAPYGFIGTPKSDYTWRSGPGRAWPADAYHRLKGSEWDPWEWALMARPRCRLVASRDGITARGLVRHGVAALAPGNPMMDGLVGEPLPASLQGYRRLVLLAGSRLPEARGNFARLLDGLLAWSDGSWDDSPVVLLAPGGSKPTSEELAPMLRWRDFEPAEPPAGSGAAAAWRRLGLLLLLGPGRFTPWASWGEVGLATAGTATEQMVGLWIPALSLPGPGPQFKLGFAQRQSRLLGGAVQVCRTQGELAAALQQLLVDPIRRQQLGAIGQRHMGLPGGSEALAALVEQRLLT